MLLRLLLLPAALLWAAEPEVLLWPSGAPGSEGRTSAEVVDPKNPNDNFVRLSNIHRPSVTVFLPPPEKATGAAFVIAPGGGHSHLAIEHEGYNVARFLSSIGVAGFVLKYRLAREKNSPYKVEVHALADVQRAIRMVRSRAAEWKVNPARVGVIGFSAGGELAALASSRTLPGKPDAADPLDRFGTRPDFQALIYPGKGAAGTAITKDAPPAFLLCAEDDRGPSQALTALFGEFKQAGVPVEIHIYGSGGHGFGIRPGHQPHPIGNSWFLRLQDWLEDRRVLQMP